MDRDLMKKNRKEFRVSGIVIFSVAAGLLLMRIALYYIRTLFVSGEAWDELKIDAIFSIPLQVGIMLIMPFLVYKFALKKSFKEVLHFSNVRKTKPMNLLISAGIGVLAPFVSMGLSTIWLMIIVILGYEPSSSGTVMPETFNAGFFVISLLLTGVLPAVCEEFTYRGGMLTVFKKTYPLMTAVMLSALMFGLGHQSIRQVFYTACFGALMAFMTLRTKSIFPAMIMHFLNNGISVYMEHAEAYGWFGGGMTDKLQNMNFMLVMLLFMLFFFAVIALIYCMQRINPEHDVLPEGMTYEQSKYKSAADGKPNTLDIDKYKVKNAPPLIIDNKMAMRMPYVNINVNKDIDPFSEEPAAQLKTEPQYYYINGRYYMVKESVFYPMKSHNAAESFKPSLSDMAFYYAAIGMMALSTIFSFVWGFII